MNKCNIIMYHYVRPIKESKFPRINGLELNGFIRQINYFKNNGNFIDSSQLFNSLNYGKHIPSNSFLLTFDDGLKDHFSYVFPILKKNKINGLFFPPLQPLYEKIVLPVHKIHFILEKNNDEQKLFNKLFDLINFYKEEFNLESPKNYFDNLKFTSRFDSNKIEFIKKILQKFLLKKPRELIINKLFEEFVSEDEKSFSENLYMNIDEIKEMKEEGMFFGGHGYSHSWFTSLSSEQLEFEIQKCREFCQKINQSNILIMCYPYGDFDKNVTKIAHDNGFEVGLTTEIGTSVLEKNKSMILPRFDTNDFPQ